MQHYQAFRDLQNADDKDKRDVENEICDISNEVVDLEEIMDIRDELNMIERLLEDQKLVHNVYSTSNAHDTPRQELDTLLRDLDFRLSKLNRLGKVAESVEKSVRLMKGICEHT